MKQLCANVGIDNVLECLRLVDQYNASKLKKVTLSFVATNWPKLRDTKYAEDFIRNYPLLAEAMDIMQNK